MGGAAISSTEQIRIKPGQSNLEIHYTALSLSRPQQVRFKYRLSRLDEDWVDAGTRRTAYYSQLSPGEYTFTVTVDNGDGVWNNDGAALEIVVIPPFWRTWWLFSLALGSVAGACILGYRFRVAHLLSSSE